MNKNKALYDMVNAARETQDNNNTEDASRYFDNHKQTFTGINAGKYLDEEDFLIYAKNVQSENQRLLSLNEELKNQMADSLKLYENQNNTIISLNKRNEVLVEALKLIESRSCFLDSGVNKAGDKQISELWKIAQETIIKLESQSIHPTSN